MNNSYFFLSTSAFLSISFKDNPSESSMEADFMRHALHTASTIEKPACSRHTYKFTCAASFRP